MTYKETLFFVAKCLTINHENHNKILVEQELKEDKIDWEAVVKVSTAHYIFPALYCNLKQAKFLHYLPNDLVEYMEHITNLNRERNEQIIKQAKEINSLLLENNITPIFLKGTGNLLEGLYEDIAERMVGDIDFIISKENYEKSIQILKKEGYNNKPHALENVKLGKHYPRIVHPQKNMAVEIHFKILRNSYSKNLDFNTLSKNSILSKKNIRILNSEYQIIHTIFNKQINDSSFWYKKVSLRNNYDTYLLSNKVNSLKVIRSFDHYFDIANSFLASVSFFMNSNKVNFKENTKSKSFIKKQLNLIENPSKSKLNQKKWDFYFINKSRLRKIGIAFYDYRMRKHFLNLIKTKLSF